MSWIAKNTKWNPNPKVCDVGEFDTLFDQRPNDAKIFGGEVVARSRDQEVELWDKREAELKDIKKSWARCIQENIALRKQIKVAAEEPDKAATMEEKDAEIASLKKEIQKMKDHQFKFYECMPDSHEHIEILKSDGWDYNSEDGWVQEEEPSSQETE